MELAIGLMTLVDGRWRARMSGWGQEYIVADVHRMPLALIGEDKPHLFKFVKDDQFCTYVPLDNVKAQALGCA